jgi:hypothetical protein
MLKRDSLPLGFILGFLAPLLSMLIYYFYKFYPTFSLLEFFAFLKDNKTQITAISVPCLLLNIALFTLYINSGRDRTARGIFVVTLVYAIISLALKFIL